MEEWFTMRYRKENWTIQLNNDQIIIVTNKNIFEQLENVKQKRACKDFNCFRVFF